MLWLLFQEGNTGMLTKQPGGSFLKAHCLGEFLSLGGAPPTIALEEILWYPV